MTMTRMMRMRIRTMRLMRMMVAGDEGLK